jgi:hypothetical protein
MPNVNKPTNEDRFADQDRRAHSGRSPLVILAIVIFVIGVGFLMMLFTH